MIARIAARSAHALAMAMLDDLKASRASIEDILEAIEDETWDDRRKNGKFNPKRRQAMVRALGLREQAQTLGLICSILAKVIPLERKAFNLDNDEPADDADPLIRLRREISGNALRPIIEVDSIGDGDTAA